MYCDVRDTVSVFVQLWLISDHHYRQVLHNWEIRKGFNLKKMKLLILNGILRMAMRNIFIPYIQKDSSKQRSQNRHTVLPQPVVIVSSHFRKLKGRTGDNVNKSPQIEGTDRWTEIH